MNKKTNTELNSISLNVPYKYTIKMQWLYYSIYNWLKNNGYRDICSVNFSVECIEFEIKKRSHWYEFVPLKISLNPGDTRSDYKEKKLMGKTRNDNMSKTIKRANASKEQMELRKFIANRKKAVREKINEKKLIEVKDENRDGSYLVIEIWDKEAFIERKESIENFTDDVNFIDKELAERTITKDDVTERAKYRINIYWKNPKDDDDELCSGYASYEFGMLPKGVKDSEMNTMENEVKVKLKEITDNIFGDWRGNDED